MKANSTRGEVEATADDLAKDEDSPKVAANVGHVVIDTLSYLKNNQKTKQMTDNNETPQHN